MCVRARKRMDACAYMRASVFLYACACAEACGYGWMGCTAKIQAELVSIKTWYAFAFLSAGYTCIPGSIGHDWFTLLFTSRNTLLEIQQDLQLLSGQELSLPLALLKTAWLTAGLNAAMLSRLQLSMQLSVIALDADFESFLLTRLGKGRNHDHSL